MSEFPQILGNLAPDVQKFIFEKISVGITDPIPEVLCIDYDMYIIICVPTVKLLEIVVALLL
jgi:hypothetical protein